MADTLRLDPVVVFRDPDPMNWRIRLAAHNVLMDEKKKQAQKK